MSAPTVQDVNPGTPPTAASGTRVLTSSRHISALDGLRGIAVLLVMLRHFVQDMSRDNTIDRLMFFGLRLGSCGVDLFFVLSGFLITGILLDAKDRPGYFKNFYMRRTLRIFPLYYLMLIIAFWLWPLVIHQDELLVLGQAAHYKPWYFLYAANILFTLDGDYKGLTCVWSLCVEEQFYLLWPLVVYLVSRRAMARTCVLFILSAIVLRLVWHQWIAPELAPVLIPEEVAVRRDNMPHIGAYTMMPMRMDGLALGGLVACVARMPGGLDRLRRIAPWTAGVCLVLVGVLLSTQWGEGRTSAQMIFGATPLAGLFASVLVMVVRPRPEAKFSPLAWLCNARFLRLCGAYSYSMYLFHAFVISAIDQKITQMTLPKFHGIAAPAVMVYIAACTALTIGFGWLTWHLFEKHFLALKRFFEYR